MAIKIRRVAILGAGVMGAQIAAHLAAAGVRAYLLDLPSDQPPSDPKLAKLVGKRFRSTRSIAAIAALSELKPSPVSHPSILDLIIPGNFDDDWSVLADADWIIEAVVERLDIKKSIHKKIAEVARPHVPVTTNTSGILLRDIASDLPEAYLRRFFGVHFFNPPRYMRLVEIIKHEDTDANLVSDLSQWISERLGKGIVDAGDHINFIANRIGVFAIMSAIKHMTELGLNVPTVDAITGTLIGRAKSASLRTVDVVGLDTFAHVANNVTEKVKDDPYYSTFALAPWLKELIAKGFLGQKSKSGGFYQKSKNNKGDTIFLTLDYKTGTHVEQDVDAISWLKDAGAIRSLPERLKFIFAQKGVHADYLWRLHRDLFSYAALLVEEIADGSPKSLDEAMRWGFNWEAGPFETWQAVGSDVIYERLKAEKVALPSWAKSGIEFYQPKPGTPEYLFSGPSREAMIPSLKHKEVQTPKHIIRLPKAANPDDPRLIIGNKSASLLDIGHGVACLSFHSKMNTLNDEIIDLLPKVVAKVDQSFAGLVISNDGDHFSAGANLVSILTAIDAGDFAAIERMIRNLQAGLQLIKFAPFPSVSAPHGLTLGGGCEVSLHASRCLIANDCFAGLVEVGVGLIPAGGGTKELAIRSYELASRGDQADPMPYLQRAFGLIGMGKTSSSGREARAMGLYPMESSLSMSRDHHTHQAKSMVLAMSDLGYAAAIPHQALKVPGDPAIQTFKMMLYNMQEGKQISAYDAFVGECVATVLCGGPVDGGSLVSEQYFLELERSVFIELCKRPETRARIDHMLKTGKPLRN